VERLTSGKADSHPSARLLRRLSRCAKRTTKQGANLAKLDAVLRQMFHPARRVAYRHLRAARRILLPAGRALRRQGAGGISGGIGLGWANAVGGGDAFCAAAVAAIGASMLTMATQRSRRRPVAAQRSRRRSVAAHRT
jgi:hypothetical protein